MAPYVRYANQGATRNLPLNPKLVDAFSFLPELGLAMEVFSGGQPAKGTSPNRVGSVRHDHGNAADVFFSRGDQRLDWAREADRPIFQDIVRRAAERGVTGFGAGPGYMQPGSMHVGFGSRGVWGAGGSGANAPDWLRQAFSGAASAPAAPVTAPAQTTARLFDTAPMAQQPGASGPAPTLLGDVVAPRRVQSVAVPPAGLGDVLAAQMQARQQQQLVQAEEQAAEQARRAALFGGDLFGPYG